MKATAGRPQSVGSAATAGRAQPVEQGHVSLTSSLMLSLVLHGTLVLWLLGSAWLLSRSQPYRLVPQTVFLVGDSPVAIDQVLGEGGGVPGAKPDNKEPGGENAVTPPPPKPVAEKAAPAPPKPVVEKAAPPAPIPKPVVEKAVPVPLKPPPEAMTLTQKETKPTPPPAPLTSTSSEAQQKLAKLRERQVEQETAETKTATAVQQKVAQLREQQAQQGAAEQRVASLRAEQTEKQAAQQRITALRARVGSGDSGEGSSSSGGGTAGTGSGSGAPGGGRGTGTAGAGSTGTGGLSGIRLRSYQAELEAKIKNAWNIPSRSKGLQAAFFLSINRDGHVEQARLVRGSGNTLFDESLQQAIKQAQPLPPLPEGIPDRTLNITLNFRDSS